jgi:hypothetical protein
MLPLLGCPAGGMTMKRLTEDQARRIAVTQMDY